MREIKFRGKSRKTGEWLVGDLLQVANDVFIAPSDGDWFDFILWSKNNVFHLPSATYVVIPDTVGQFTGLLDKNGKEIYEGDIISERLKGHRKYQDAYQVMFVDYQWWGKNGYGNCTSLSLFEEFHDIKVIGNIHENPELMK